MTARERRGTAPSPTVPAVEVAKERLRELGAVFHSISEGLVFLTPDRYVAEMNPAALRMFGFTSSHQARRPLAALAESFQVTDLEGRPLATEEQPPFRALLGEAFSDVELRVHRAGGDGEWIGSFSGGPVFNGSGDVALAVVTIRDVTARARADRERRRVEEALRVSEERFRTAVRASTRSSSSSSRWRGLSTGAGAASASASPWSRAWSRCTAAR